MGAWWEMKERDEFLMKPQTEHEKLTRQLQPTTTEFIISLINSQLRSPTISGPQLS